MIPFRRVLSAAVLALLALAISVGGALAQSQDLYWERYDVDIAVQPNGDLRVTETQIIVFTSGTFHEGFAELSTKNTDGITDVTVSEDGQPYEEVRSTNSVNQGEFAVDPGENNTLQVVWGMGRTRNETRTFELAYTVQGAIRRYANSTQNEFQWNALEPGMRDFPVRASRVTLTLPEGLTFDDVDYIVEQGFRSVPMNVTVADDRRSATAEATQSIGSDEGIQVVAKLLGPLAGSAPSWQAAFDAQTRYEQNVKPVVDLGAIVAGLLLLFGGPALLYVLWYARGRDPKIDAVPEHITAPPEGLTPAIAGTLVDERADVRDVIATIMDLGQRGFLAIEETSESGPFRLVSREYTLHNTSQGKNLNELNPFERQLFDAVFAGREKVRFRDMNQRFYTSMTRLQHALYQTAHQGGYFTSSPEATRSSYGCLGGGLLALVIFGGFFVVGGLSSFTSYAICPFIALGLVGAGLIWLGQHMPRKTRKGAEAAALARAFRNYLTNLEKYTDPNAVKEQFDKYLPWAIAFGLERTWINRFQRIPDTPVPGWYFPPTRPFGTYGYPYGTAGTAPGTGGGLNRPTTGSAEAPHMPTLGEVSGGLSGGLQGMSEGLSSMLNSAGRVMTSTPPSSSTSRGGRSFSGGGFRSSGGSGGGGRGFR